MFVDFKKCIGVLSLVTMSFYSVKALGLDRDGNGDRSGVVALYLFDSSSGDVVTNVMGDNSLDLYIDRSTGRAEWRESEGKLEILQETLLSTQNNADSITEQCRGTDALTVEAWIENQKPGALERMGPLRIITLSSRSDNSSFFLGQNYDGNPFYQFNVKRGPNGDLNDVDSSLKTPQGVFKTSTSTEVNIQHVIVTVTRGGVARLYVSDDLGVPILRDSSTRFTGNFDQWISGFKLGLGNELSYKEPRGPNNYIDPNNPLFKPDFTTETRGWRGSFHMVAVRCRSLSSDELLGDRAPSNWLAGTPIQISLDDPIRPSQTRALNIYKRLVGTSTPIDDPKIKEMADYIDDGSQQGLLNAAKVATSHPGFYNRTVKDFANRMSNRENTVSVPLNDFSAMVIGHTHAEGDVTELLTGDFFYRGDPTKTAVPQDLVADILTSNNHYEGLENLNYDLSRVLIREENQKVYDGVQTIYNHPDAAGLITTRAFMAAHAVAGTNRRLVEYSFQEFLCRPINLWADNTAPDNMVSRDVDRFPTGSHTKYQTSCRGCHSQMDSLRTAFSRITFENSFVKHAWVMSPDGENDPNNNPENMSTMVQVPRGIAGKMNRNNDTFPLGFEVTNDLWINHATTGLNAQYFGWDSSTLTGDGIKQYGQMIAKSQAFPRCLVKRAFRSVCKRDLEDSESDFVQTIATEFKDLDNMVLKRLFERIAVTPKCLGQ